jgi:hypothetical protein
MNNKHDILTAIAMASTRLEQAKDLLEEEDDVDVSEIDDIAMELGSYAEDAENVAAGVRELVSRITEFADSLR